MKYISTRDETATPHTFKHVIMQGLSPDGGLFVPSEIPQLESEEIKGWADLEYPDLCMKVMAHFIPEDQVSKADLQKIINKSYVGEKWADKKVVPLTELPNYDGICVLEQFLGNLFEHFISEGHEHVTVLGATSGDTGG